MKKVFEVHPNATEIFVVNGMPFLKENEAEKHCDDLKISYDEIETVTKGASASKAANGSSGAGQSDTGGEGSNDYSKMKKADLQSELVNREISFDSKAKNADLIALLEQADADTTENAE